LKNSFPILQTIAIIALASWIPLICWHFEISRCFFQVLSYSYPITQINAIIPLATASPASAWTFAITAICTSFIAPPATETKRSDLNSRLGFINLRSDFRHPVSNYRIRRGAGPHHHWMDKKIQAAEASGCWWQVAGDLLPKSDDKNKAGGEAPFGCASLCRPSAVTNPHEAWREQLDFSEMLLWHEVNSLYCITDFERICSIKMICWLTNNDFTEKNSHYIGNS
jgi:hypothetical protein